MDDRIRSDFPIDWEQDNHVSRREFFKFLTLASGGLAAGSAVLALFSLRKDGQVAFEPMLVCSDSDVALGGSLAFTYPRKTDLCILVRRMSGELVAYSRRCTHLSCPVSFEADMDRLYCPCHNGAFAAEDGSVLQGPPPHPLPRIILEDRDGDVWAVGVRRGEGTE